MGVTDIYKNWSLVHVMLLLFLTSLVKAESSWAEAAILKSIRSLNVSLHYLEYVWQLLD